MGNNRRPSPDAFRRISTVGASVAITLGKGGHLDYTASDGWKTTTVTVTGFQGTSSLTVCWQTDNRLVHSHESEYTWAMSDGGQNCEITKLCGFDTNSKDFKGAWKS